MTFARVRAFIVVGVLVTAAVVFVVVALLRDTQSDAQVGSRCPDGALRANLALPRPKEVKIRVLNGTDNDDLGNRVSEDFKNRKFQTEKPGDNEKVVEGIAQLRYGAKSVGAAHLLDAYFLGKAEPLFDPTRRDDIVDVIVGTRFQQLATQTEVNQSLVELGGPSPPPGTCAAPN